MLGVQELGRRRARAGCARAAQRHARLGRWARAGRHGKRAWALGVARRQACVGARAGADRRQQRASAAGAQQGERLALARGRAGQAAAGARLGGRALGAGRTGPWAQEPGACAVGPGSVRGIGRQGARLGAPGVLAGPVGGSCTRLDFQTGFSTRYFSRVTK